MWVASFGAGVYRSLDGGVTWKAYRSGLINTFVRCLAVQPLHPDSVLCGTNDGVFLSVDGGVTWKALLSTTRSVRSLAIHPVRTGVVYAALYGGGVYKSLNAGASWSAINLGLVNTNVRDIAIYPTRPETLLAATGTGGGIHRSFNGGLSWAQVPDTTATRGAAEQVQFDALDPSRIYVAELDRGVLRSTDGGTNWGRINGGLSSFRGRSLAVVDTLRWFGTDGAGVFVTSLNDTMWHPVDIGPTGRVVDALWSSAAEPSTALAGTDGDGMFLTSDRGASWIPVDGGLMSTQAFSLAVRPSTHVVYAGTGFGDQFWRSADVGASWTRATRLVTNNSEHGVAPDPLLAGRVYLSAYGSGVYRSDDDGATWLNPDSLNATLTNRFVRPLLVWPGQSEHLFVGTGIGPFESTDGGAQWASRVGNLPAGFGVHSMALVPGVPATLYVGNDSAGVYRSNDGGTTWNQKSAGLLSPFVRAIVVDAVDPLRVYVATDSGVFRSVDGGNAWVAARAGLPAGLVVRALVQDPAHGALFCGVYGGGVFESVDGAGTWLPVFGQQGLSDLHVRALAVDTGQRALYAGTENGVASVTFYDALDVPRPVAGSRLSLSASPNPSSGSGPELRFAMARAGSAQLSIYDTAGRRVRVLADAWLEAGEHEARWDGRDARGFPAPAGLYFARLVVPDGVRVVRLARLMR